jgi:hypothetical protein
MPLLPSHRRAAGASAATAAATAAGAPSADAPSGSLQRRQLLSAGLAAAAGLAALVPPAALAADGVEVVSDEAGSGQYPAAVGDLVLVHYTGERAASDAACTPHFDRSLGQL